MKHFTPTGITHTIITILVFVSAFLLFTIQPTLTKLLLPGFGGSAMVWTTLNLFFQLLLLGGYTLVFLLRRTKKPLALYAYLSTLGLAAVVVVLQLLSGPNLAVISSTNLHQPIIELLRLSLVLVGLPLFLLTSFSTMLQLLAQRLGSANPFKLYIASNLGSFLGLWTYPFLIEPLSTAYSQHMAWLGACGMLFVGVAALLWKEKTTWLQAAEENNGKSTPLLLLLQTTVAAAIPVLLSLSVTQELSSGTAPIPFLWIIPLSLYLLSFVLGFRNIKWPSAVIKLGWLICIGLLLLFTYQSNSLELFISKLLFLPLLVFVGSTYLHHWLYTQRHNFAYLPTFYLCLSLGGAVGGVIATLISPLLFREYLELSLALGALAGFLVFTTHPKIWEIHKRVFIFPVKFNRADVLNITIAALVAHIGFRLFLNGESSVVFAGRNFYGIARVEEVGQLRQLSNGATIHGQEKIDGPRNQKNSYYAEDTGVGQSFAQLRKSKSALHVGAIGLGVGTVASYCSPGDTFVFYEINSMVVELAKNYFNFLKNCPQVEIKIADGRTGIQSANEPFDLIIVDAFTDDTIPTHLLTLEAFQLYLTKLHQNGFVAIHTSNKVLDITKLVASQAEKIHKPYLVLESKTDAKNYIYDTEWVVMGNSLAFDEFQGKRELENLQGLPAWTDQKISFLPFFRFLPTARK